jgi:hypothetical protein
MSLVDADTYQINERLGHIEQLVAVMNERLANIERLLEVALEECRGMRRDLGAQR